MHAPTLLALSLLLTVGCTSHESTDAKPETDRKVDSTPEPDPEPEPPAVVARASIASVQMIQDCPEQDPPPPAPAQAPAASRAKPMPGAPARPMDMERSAGDSVAGWDPPEICTQSTMQLTFSGQGDEPGQVRIRGVRVLKPGGGAPLSTITARAPTRWNDDGAYVPWDEVIPAGTDLKASYRLSVPDWSALERALGGSSFGPMFVLEVELEIDGQTQTVRSPEFPRERPHVIVT